jgi:hypothetical protein
MIELKILIKSSINVHIDIKFVKYLFEICEDLNLNLEKYLELAINRKCNADVIMFIYSKIDNKSFGIKTLESSIKYNDYNIFKIICDNVNQICFSKYELDINHKYWTPHFQIKHKKEYNKICKYICVQIISYWERHSSTNTINKSFFDVFIKNIPTKSIHASFKGYFNPPLYNDLLNVIKKYGEKILLGIPEITNEIYVTLMNYKNIVYTNKSIGSRVLKLACKCSSIEIINHILSLDIPFMPLHMKILCKRPNILKYFIDNNSIICNKLWGAIILNCSKKSKFDIKIISMCHDLSDEEYVSSSDESDY